MSAYSDIFISAFLSKISEFEFVKLQDEDRNEIVTGYMKRAISVFNKLCKYDLLGAIDDEPSVYIPDEDIDEISDIVSEGMIVQWLKPYIYQQENLQNVLNTKDYTTYSPAELLMRIGNAYSKAQKDYTQMVREYSYNNGDLSDLHA